MTDIIQQITSITDENIKLKEENEKLKKQLAEMENKDEFIKMNEENEKLQNEIAEINKKVHDYEEKIKTINPENLEKLISLVRSLKLKMNLIKNDYNKISFIVDILYEYYQTAKLINPNIIELTKKINDDKVKSYIFKYRFNNEIKFTDCVNLENDTTLDPIVKSPLINGFIDIDLPELTKDSKFEFYEDELFKQIGKQEKNPNDDIEIKK